jgi:hypothetical protein
MQKGELVKRRPVYVCTCGAWTDVTEPRGPWKPACITPPEADPGHMTCGECELIAAGIKTLQGVNYG